jgi:hypothetical protein
MNIGLDIEELWPDASTLVGVQVASDADFERCEAILRGHGDSFRLTRPEDRYLVVRRAEARLLSEAGLEYREIELVAMDDLPPQERYERQRAMIEAQMPEFLARLRQQL